MSSNLRVSRFGLFARVAVTSLMPCLAAFGCNQADQINSSGASQRSPTSTGVSAGPASPADNGVNASATLFANNDTDLIANVGDEIVYNWAITGASVFSSLYDADQPDLCPGGYSGNGDKPWVINSVGGSATGTVNARVQPCQAGRTYTIWANWTPSFATLPSTLSTIKVQVLPLAANSPTSIEGITVESGNGVILDGGFASNDVVVAAVWGSDGFPIAGATVNWTLPGGTDAGGLRPAGSDGVTGSGTSVTDSNGYATMPIEPSSPSPNLGFEGGTIVASAQIGGTSYSTHFLFNTLTNIPGVGVRQPAIAFDSPPDLAPLTAAPNTTIKGAFVLRVYNTAGYLINQPIPNVGVTVTGGTTTAAGPVAHCAGGTVFTNSLGSATCDLVVGSGTGTTSLVVNVGNRTVFDSYSLTVAQ